MESMPTHQPKTLQRLLIVASLAVLLSVAGYFLWAEHEAHVVAAIPFLPFIVVAGIVLHLFYGGANWQDVEQEDEVPKGKPDKDPP